MISFFPAILEHFKDKTPRELVNFLWRQPAPNISKSFQADINDKKTRQDPNNPSISKFTTFITSFPIASIQMQTW